MKLSKEEKKISEEAKDFIRANEGLLVERFANDEDYPPQENPASFFTAGSFGAGKTEFSQRLSERISGLILIDADEIRKLCPDYDGEKAYVFNGAAFIGQDKLHSYALSANKNFVFDSSFSSYKNAKKNIKRSLKRARPVEVYYVFQDPKVAWFFTQVRAKLQGRHISKDAFIGSVLRSRKTTEKVKREFGDKISLHVVRKSISSNVSGDRVDDLTKTDLQEIQDKIVTKDVFQDVGSIDNRIEFDYSESDLKQIL